MKRIDFLRAEWDKVTARLAAMDEAAATRSFTEEEEAESKTLLTRSEELTEEIKKCTEREDARRATADILARHETEDGGDTRIRSGVAGEPIPCTPGEYLALFFRARLGNKGRDEGTPDREALDALMRVAQSNHPELTLTRSDAQQVTSDNLGVVPTLIIGDVIKFVDANRYAVNAMRKLPMPQGGTTFKRPRVTQRTLAGTQASEFTALTSQAMDIAGDVVTKQTVGTVLDISEQDIDWTDPALLQIAIEDLAQSYAIETETLACSAITTAMSGQQVAYSLSEGTAGFLEAISTAAKDLYNNAKKLPDVLFASTDQWAYLLGLVDNIGRPLFPTLNPTNSAGQMGRVDSWQGNPMGVELVVSPEFNSGTLCLGVTQFLEVYEVNKGFLQLPQPSTLSIIVAYRGYFATNAYSQGVYALLGS
jgi:hypothetical protein